MDKTQHQLPPGTWGDLFFSERISNKKKQTPFLIKPTAKNQPNVGKYFPYKLSVWKTQRFLGQYEGHPTLAFLPDDDFQCCLRSLAQSAYPSQGMPPWGGDKNAGEEGYNRNRNSEESKVKGIHWNLRILSRGWEICWHSNLFPILSSSSWHLKWFWKELPGEPTLSFGILRSRCFQTGPILNVRMTTGAFLWATSLKPTIKPYEQKNTVPKKHIGSRLIVVSGPSTLRNAKVR